MQKRPAVNSAPPRFLCSGLFDKCVLPVFAINHFPLPPKLSQESRYSLALSPRESLEWKTNPPGINVMIIPKWIKPSPSIPFPEVSMATFTPERNQRSSANAPELNVIVYRRIMLLGNEPWCTRTYEEEVISASVISFDPIVLIDFCGETDIYHYM